MTTKKKSTNSVASKNKPVKQKDLIAVMIISLILGFGGGYVVSNASSNNSPASEETVMEMGSADMAHSHDGMTYEVESADAPIVRLIVTEDAKSGYNVKLVTDKFTFTPENVNQANIAGEGHAHLYVDGVKIGRLYGPNYHYGVDFEGSKTFKVTLNANDHSEYTVNGEVIESEVVVTHDSSDSSHDEMHMDTEDHSNSDM